MFTTLDAEIIARTHRDDLLREAAAIHRARQVAPAQPSTGRRLARALWVIAGRLDGGGQQPNLDPTPRVA